jgi:ankyrin repeat protein
MPRTKRENDRMDETETDHESLIGPVYDLRNAVYDADLAEIESLLDAGIDVNLRDGEDDTALMWAADEGFIDVVRLLLGHGADVNITGGLGWTPLLMAAQTNRVEVVRVLLQAGADVTAQTSGSYVWTALFIARRNANIPLVDLLIEYGARE